MAPGILNRRSKFFQAAIAAAILGFSAAVFAQNFTISAVSGKIITPNGDGKNDDFIVSFYNPQFSQISGKIFDLNGHLVATMTSASSPLCPSQPTLQCLMWDGKSNGQEAQGGVYVYLLQSGSEVYDGTVALIR